MHRREGSGFKRKDADWEMMYKALIAFLKKPRPPEPREPRYIYPRGGKITKEATAEARLEAKLAQWTATQREAYRKANGRATVTCSNAILTPYRIAQLERINFVWDYADVGQTRRNRHYFLIVSRFD